MESVAKPQAVVLSVIMGVVVSGHRGVSRRDIVMVI